MTFNRATDAPILQHIEDADAYSDMSYFDNVTCINGNEYYKELHNEYPEAYYVMNLREMEGWIQSRTNHPNLVTRAMAYMGTQDLAEVQQRWREQRNAHLTEARSYFNSIPCSRYFEFWVDNDPIDKLSEFVSDHYSLNLDAWVKCNVT